MKVHQWLLAGVTAVLLTACSSDQAATDKENHQDTHQDNTAQLLKSSTPADVNCTLAGGTMAQSRHLNGSSFGTCQLANGKRCDERALMNGTCPAG